MSGQVKDLFFTYVLRTLGIGRIVWLIPLSKILIFSITTREQQISYTVQNVLIFYRTSEAIDLCIFLGTCGNKFNNQNNGRSNQDIPEATQIDSEWIEPKDSTNNQIYHFANDVSAMNW